MAWCLPASPRAGHAWPGPRSAPHQPPRAVPRLLMAERRTGLPCQCSQRPAPDGRWVRTCWISVHCPDVSAAPASALSCSLCLGGLTGLGSPIAGPWKPLYTPLRIGAPASPASARRSAQCRHPVVPDSFRPHRRQASLSITNSCSLLKLMSIESVMPSNHLILCCPRLLLPSIFPSIRVFSNESALPIRWPKYWSFSLSISPSNEHPGLISFRMDWLDLLAVQGTLKSLLQHHSSKASILWRSAFFTLQLSHPYMITGKTIALTRRTFVGKVMSLLLNMLSSLVITFLPRSNCLLIPWLQSPSAVILKPPKINSLTVSIVSLSICYEVMEPDAMILIF